MFSKSDQKLDYIKLKQDVDNSIYNLTKNQASATESGSRLGNNSQQMIDKLTTLQTDIQNAITNKSFGNKDLSGLKERYQTVNSDINKILGAEPPKGPKK